MYKRLNELNFVIGLFFTIVSFILLADNFFTKGSNDKLNFYTGLIFLVFGLFMISIKTKRSDD
jgi:purine-cytosine permease-like protein